MFAPGMGYFGSYGIDGATPEPVAPEIPFMLAIDWNGDGMFAGGVEDVTAYVVSGSTFRGKDDPSNLKGVAVAGTMVLDLLNLDGAWSKFNSSSPFYGNIKPNRRVGLWATAPLSKKLWSGKLDRVDPRVTNGALPRATLYALGVLADLIGEEATITPSAMNGEFTGEVIAQILDTYGLPSADRDIDTGTVPVGRYYPSESQANDLIREMVEQEGGELREGLEWDIVSRDRYDRLLNHDTSVATFTDDGMGMGYREIEQSDPGKNVFNKFEATITPHSLGESGITLWTLTDVITLGVGETRTYFVQMPTDIEGQRVAYIDPWESIEIGRDDTVLNFFPIVSGTPESLGDVRVTPTVFATALKLVIENIDTDPHTVTGLQVFGTPVIAGDSYKVTDQDATSIIDFGPRRFPFTSRWFPNAAYARASMAYELARHKDEHPILTKTIVASDADLFEQCVSRDIDDRITVEADGSQTQLGIDQDFFIESIAHSFGAKRLFRTTFTLSPVIDVYDGESPFLLDSSLLDSDDVLVY